MSKHGRYMNRLSKETEPRKQQTWRKYEMEIRKCDWSSWRINHRIHINAGKYCI